MKRMAALQSPRWSQCIRGAVRSHASDVALRDTFMPPLVPRLTIPDGVVYETCSAGR